MRINSKRFNKLAELVGFSRSLEIAGDLLAAEKYRIGLLDRAWKEEGGVYEEREGETVERWR